MHGKNAAPRMVLLILFALLWTLSQPVAAGASSPSSFFAGRTIRIVVGFSPGGGFDTFARLLARHLGSQVPGNPRVIVQNMPGAGSLVAANRIYAMQPGDGLNIVTFSYDLVSQALAGDPAVKFDPLKYLWLGEPTTGSLPRVLWLHSDLGIRSLEDLLKRKEPVALGTTGVGSSISIAGKFLRHLALPVKNVYGYRGSSAIMPAVERKEVDGIILSRSAMQKIYSRYLTEGILRPILAIGSDPHQPFPGVATLEDLKLDPDRRKLAEFLTGVWTMLWTYAVPPGTPPERFKALQEAFLQALKSPRLIKDADRQGVIIAARSGKQVLETIRTLTQAPPQIIGTYKEFLGMKK